MVVLNIFLIPISVFFSIKITIWSIELGLSFEIPWKMSIKNTNNEAFWLRSLERFANGAFRFCFEMNPDLFFSQRFSCGAPSRPIRAKKRRRRPTDSPAPATVAVRPDRATSSTSTSVIDRSRAAHRYCLHRKVKTTPQNIRRIGC